MIDPQALYNKAMEAAEDMADKEYAYGTLEDGLSTLEGMLITELKGKGEPVTLIPKLIKQDEKWVLQAENVRKAKKEYILAKFKYEQVCRFQDNQRTKETTERALAR
jgi:hypothetical protein